MSGFIGPKPADVPVGTIATKGTVSANVVTVGPNNTINTSVATFLSKVSIGADISDFTSTGKNATLALSGTFNLEDGNPIAWGGGTGRVSITGNKTNGTLVLACSGNTSGYFNIATGNSERFRITGNGDIGIGTTTPTQKLSVVSAAQGDAISWTNGVANAKTGYLYSDENISGIFNVAGAGAGRIGMWMYPGNGLIFDVGAQERMRIDANGNIGLGVTPSDWGTGVVGFNFGTRASLATNNLNNVLGVNAVWANSAWRYITSSVAASQYVQWGAEHQWFVAPTGTAGANITFTQAMTLAANGNLGVGLTNPTYKLDVAGTVRTTGITRLGMNVGYYNINSSSTDLTSANTSAVQICGTGGDGLFIGQYANTVSTVWIQASYFNPSLATYPIILNPLGGNIGIGIGNTAPASRLHVANEIRVGRTDASAEGGEIKLCRSTDDAAAYSIDVYGSGTNPELRMFNSIGGTVFFSSSNNGVNYIKFNPTAANIGDANCLDDYEEGTWTPTDGSGAGLSLSGSGSYVKIGRLVTVWARVTYPSTSSTALNAISGIPFSNNPTQYSGTMSITNHGNSDILPMLENNIFILRNYSNGTYTNANLSGKFYYFWACYTAA